MSTGVAVTMRPIGDHLLPSLTCRIGRIFGSHGLKESGGPCIKTACEQSPNHILDSHMDRSWAEQQTLFNPFGTVGVVTNVISPLLAHRADGRLTVASGPSA
jgi:hypothetical protein